VNAGPYNQLVFPLAIPLAGADGHDVRYQPIGLDLEVVGVEQVGALPGPLQHVEHSEQGDRRPHADKHLTKVDEDHH
jgi:hypothetical protein